MLEKENEEASIGSIGRKGKDVDVRKISPSYELSIEECYSVEPFSQSASIDQLQRATNTVNQGVVKGWGGSRLQGV